MNKGKERGSFLIEYAIILLLVGIVVAITVSILFSAAPELGDILPSILGL